MLEAELFAFLERTADAAFAVTREGQICSWNQAAERLFGYSSAEVLNRACYEVLDGHGALGTQVCTGDCSVQQCAAQKMEIPDFDLEVKTRSGERLWVNVSTLVFEEPRRNRHLVVHLARDIRIARRAKNCSPRCWRSPKKWWPSPTTTLGWRPSRHSPNKSSESFAYLRKPRTLPRSPANLESLCPRYGIICTASTRNSVLTTAWKP